MKSSASEQFPIESSDTLLIERRLLLSMSTIIMIGPIRFDTVSHEVESPGKTARLTPNEATTLTFLATHANQVWTPAQLCKEVSGFDTCDGSTAMIKAAIRQLRQKIEPDPNKPAYILTVPGVGYMLVIS
jgi:DNA-binding response OmpR family regulator